MLIFTAPLPILAPPSLHTNLSLPNLSTFYFHVFFSGEPIQIVRGMARGDISMDMEESSSRGAYIPWENYHGVWHALALGHGKVA